ncbi:MAG: thioredoxin domain-containing protein [Thermoplasmatota archaeon]
MREKNHLAGEKSRYLKQHAENPVDWYPWCDEAFEKAKSEDKPIFLSIGYSSCHWCHVMAHESFEDEEVAELMNDAFVSIKVDKEERPDVDMVYMDVARAMTGSGGWPLNVVITHDKKPFYAATYIPKERKYGRIGFKELIRRLKQQWENQREEIIATSENIISSLQVKRNISGRIDSSTMDRAYNYFKESFDDEYYGFGTAPKFPSPHNLLFLLTYYERTRKKTALEMVEKTLDAMRSGGIYDHLGYGFHRYSTDKKWKLPHFEKMLYDQAMMILVYSKAYKITKNNLYQKTVQETTKYVLRNLQSDRGGFYSSEDADVDGEEGIYYTWSEEEIDKILQNKSTDFKKLFDIRSQGNYQEESTGKRTGKNVLHLKDGLNNVSLKNIDELKNKLYQKRKKRKSPERDEKILSDWNGLMIASLARAAKIFDDEELLKVAERALKFILKEMKRNSHLYHRYIEGEVGIDGMMDDYAFLIWALLEFYITSERTTYLKKAESLAEKMVEMFWDNKNAGFYFSSSDDLPISKKPVYDGAYPSGNSIALLDLVLLTELTGKGNFKDKAEDLIQYFGGKVNSYPTGYSMFLTSMEYFLERFKGDT